MWDERRRLARPIQMGLRTALCLVVCASCGSKPAPAPTPTNTQPIKPPVVAPTGLPSLDRDPAAAVTCGKLDTKLTDRMPLLSDRLAMQAPKSMRSLARGYDIMSSPKPPEEEERLMLGGGKSAGAEAGDSAFVVLGRETWQLDPDRATVEPDAITHPGKLDDEAPKFLQAIYEQNLDVQAVALADTSIRAWAGRPKQVAAEAGADAALVLALVVALPDATLETVAFYVTPDLASDAGCMRLAERIGATLAVGKRPLERTAGARKLGPYSMTVPADYVTVHQPGPDFDVYTTYLLRPLSLYPGEIVVVTDAELGPDEGKVIASGKLFGKSVKWRGERTPKGGQMMTTVEPDRGHHVHVQLVATRQDKYLDAFRAVAETLKR